MGHRQQAFYPAARYVLQSQGTAGVIVVIVAFIMAKIESAKSREVLDQVRKIDAVEETYLIYGAYDLLIKGVFKTPEALSSFVVDELRRIDGVKDTVTNVCATCD
jgi:DNA-binding Lrp family transcriptional regulator